MFCILSLLLSLYENHIEDKILHGINFLKSSKFLNFANDLDCLHRPVVCALWKCNLREEDPTTGQR